MADLHDDTAVHVSGDTLRATVSPNWSFLVPNGGYLATIALRAANAQSKLNRPVNLTCNFLSVPQVGELSLAVSARRKSRRTEVFRVEMSQGDRPTVDVQIWMAAEGAGLEHQLLPAPAVPVWDRVRVSTPADVNLPGPVPPIVSNFEMRMVELEPAARAWFRFRPHAVYDDLHVDLGRAMMIVDFFVFLASLSPHPQSVAPMATLALNIHFHEFGNRADEWLLAEAVAPTAARGLLFGRSSVWNRDGRPIASAQSTMLFIGPAMPRPGSEPR
jgi:acyl-CoA thioesterase